VQLRWVWTRQLYYVPPPTPPTPPTPPGERTASPQGGAGTHPDGPATRG
jgi:hypothetical protein